MFQIKGKEEYTAQEREYYADLFRQLFPTPLELLQFYHPSFQIHSNPNAFQLHYWQREFHTKISGKRYTPDDQLMLVMKAINGSGKDMSIIAPWIMWLMLTYPDAVVVITTASQMQMRNQTEKYLDQLSRYINTKHKELHGVTIMDYVQGKKSCILTGSQTTCFVTDDPARAEGHHPVRPNGMCAIFVNEAKSVDKDIYAALYRCTPWSIFAQISSAGFAHGPFYKAWTDNDPNKLKIRVDLEDCPHLKGSEEAIKRDLGPTHPVTISYVLNEFSEIGDNVAISMVSWNSMLRNRPKFVGSDIETGIDFGGGSAETVVAVRRGNVLWKLFAFAEVDTHRATNRIAEIIKQERLERGPINGDASGIGQAMLDDLKAKGIKKLNYIYNQAKPDDANYRNLTSERWLYMGRWVEEGIIGIRPNLDPDEILKNQACTRKYKITDTGKFAIESKREMLSRGLRSPDRADAFILSFLSFNQQEARTSNEPYRFKHKIEAVSKYIPASKKVPSKLIHEKPVQLPHRVVADTKMTARELADLEEDLTHINKRIQHELAQHV